MFDLILKFRHNLQWKFEISKNNVVFPGVPIENKNKINKNSPELHFCFKSVIGYGIYARNAVNLGNILCYLSIKMKQSPEAWYL